MFRQNQDLSKLHPIDMIPTPEVTKITCLPDTGAYEKITVTIPATASATQADYLHLVNKTGTKFAIWLDIDANGTAPTGALYAASDYQIKVSIVTDGTAIQNAALAYTAITTDVNFDEFTVVNNLNGTLTLTSTLLGNITNAVPKKADDSAAGSIGVAIVAGAASSLQNKYFIMRNPAGTVYNAWFNVGGEGVDPNPAGTEIACACTAGSTAAQIAISIATAVNANSNFKAWMQDGYLYVANEATGVASDITAGDSGFTITKLQDGAAGYLYPSMNPSLIAVEPSLIS